MIVLCRRFLCNGDEKIAYSCYNKNYPIKMPIRFDTETLNKRNHDYTYFERR